MGFPSVSHSMGKSNQTHLMERTWKVSTHTSPIVYVLFSQYILILWWELHRFPINFQFHRKMQQNPSDWENLENWYPYFPQIWVLFFHQIPTLWYTLLHGKCIVFPSISNNMEKNSKIHPVSSQVVFPQYHVFQLFQNLAIP